MEANHSTNEKTPRHGPSKPPPVPPKPTKLKLSQKQNQKTFSPKLLINGQPGKEPEMVMDHTDQMPKTRSENSLPKMEDAVPIESSPFPTNDQSNIPNEKSSVTPNKDAEMLIVHNSDQQSVATPTSSYEQGIMTPRHGPSKPPPVPPKPTKLKLSPIQNEKTSTPKLLINGQPGKEPEMVMDHTDQMPKTRSENSLPTMDDSKQAAAHKGAVPIESSPFPTNDQSEIPNERSSVPPNKDTEMLIVHNSDQSVALPPSSHEQKNMTTGETPPVVPTPKTVDSKLSVGQDGTTSIPNSLAIGPTIKESETIKDDIDQMSKTSSREHPLAEDVSEKTNTHHPPIPPRSVSLLTGNDPTNVMDEPDLLSNGVVSSPVRPTNIEEETPNERQEVRINSTSLPTNSDPEMLIVPNCDQTTIPNFSTNQQEPMPKVPDSQRNKLAVGGNEAPPSKDFDQLNNKSNAKEEYDKKPSTSNVTQVQKTKTAALSKTPMVPRLNAKQRQRREFQEKYVYNLTTSTLAEFNKLEMSVVIIFGLHEKSGEKLFHKLFPNDVRTENLNTIPTQKKQFKEGKVIIIPDDVRVTVFVSPRQYAVYSLRSITHMVRKRFQNDVRCFILVFDANFVRFSSDVKKAFAHLEKKYYGPTIWNNAVLVILNSDDVIGEGTLFNYLNRQGNENLKYYADKMDGRVIALPNYPDDYDLTFQMLELMTIISSLQNNYEPAAPTTLWGKMRQFLTNGV